MGRYRLPRCRPPASLRGLALLFLFLPLALASCASRQAAAPAAPPPGGAAPAPTPRPAPAAAASKGEDPPRARGLKYVSLEREITLDAQGKATVVTRSVTEVLTRAGADQFSTVSASWSPWFQERPVLEARVKAADGTVRKLLPGTIAEEPVGSESPGTLNNRRRLRAPLPGVGAGARVEVTTTKKEKTLLAGVRGAHLYHLCWGASLQRSRITITAPASLGLKYAVRGSDLKPRKDRTEGGLRVVELELGPCPDSPRLEWDLPPELPRAPHVVLATAPSWNQVARAYHKVVQRQLDQPAAELPKLVKQAAGGASGGRAEKIRRLLEALQQRVRYTGVEFDEAAVVPRPPRVTLERRFGDCKDKSTLLVAMLREAGIEAHLALVRAGNGEPLPPDMPGLGLFNHALVHLPGPKPLWIDPTLDHARAGQVSAEVAGHMALVITPGTKGLSRIPELSPARNTYLEERHVQMQPISGAKIRERQEVSGTLEHRFRQPLAAKGAAQWKKAELEAMKKYYSARSAKVTQLSAAGDLGSPFSRTIEMERVRHTITHEEYAESLVDIGILFDWIPRLLKTARPAEKVKRRRNPLALSMPYTSRLRYRISGADGFSLKRLPANIDQAVGPGKLTVTYKSAAGGRDLEVDAVYTTGKARYTAAEVGAARDALQAISPRRRTTVNWDQETIKLVEQGHFERAFTAGRERAERFPKQVIQRCRLARGLLAAGFGAPARKEARAAVAADPTSDEAHFTLAWVLQHDLYGRLLHRGFDRDGAAASLRKARDLDPDNAVIRQSLGTLLTYDRSGWQFSPGANLKEAIAEYRHARDKLKDHDLDKTLVLALLHDGQFQAARKALEKSKGMPQQAQLMLVAIAGEKGAAAAIAHAEDRLPESRRKRFLAQAGTYLVVLRRYVEGAALQERALPPGELAARGKLDILRKTRPHEQLALKAETPANLIKRLLRDLTLSRLTVKQYRRSYCHSSVTAADARNSFTIGFGIRRATRAIQGRMNLSPTGMVDLVMSTGDYTARGNDRAGHVLRMKTLTGITHDVIFVVAKERGRYRLLGVDLESLGRAALTHLGAGRIKQARTLLMLARTDLKQGTLSASFSASFTDLLRPGAAPWKLRAGAALLTLGARDARSVEPALKQALTHELEPDLRRSVQMALTRRYYLEARWKDGLAMVTQMLKEDGDEEILMGVRVRFMERGSPGAVRKVLLAYLETNPTHRESLYRLAVLAARHGRWREVEKCLKQIRDNGMEDRGLYNDLAWYSFSHRPFHRRSLAWAEKAGQLAKHSHESTLNTMAAVYAEASDLKKAQQAWLKSMQLSGHPEPWDHDWYPYGLMAEKAGLQDLALEAYRKVHKPRHRELLSSHELARQGIARIKAARARKR